jgi:hypothetical protein
MKTKIFALITMVAIVLSTATLTHAATKTNNDEITVLSEVNNINKIEASGNVEVYITSGAKDQVKVYNNYYAQNALVQNQDGVLRISSYKTDKLIVMVTVTDLRAITANDNARVISDKTLSAIDLAVNLNDNAYAQLKLDAFAANVTVNDHAKADLTGDVNNYELDYSRSSSVNRTELTAANKIEKITTPVSTPAHRNHKYPFIIDKLASL